MWRRFPLGVARPRVHHRELRSLIDRGKSRLLELQERLANTHPLMREVVNTIGAYAVGARLLVADARRLIHERNRAPATLGEAMWRADTVHDLKRGVPLLAWFMLPFVGNSVLIVGYFMPALLPYSWRSPRQRAQLMRQAEQRVARTLPQLPPITSPLFVASLFPLYSWVPPGLVPRALQERLVLARWRRIQFEDTFGDEPLTNRQLEDWSHTRAIAVVGELPIDSVPDKLPLNGRGVPLLEDFAELNAKRAIWLKRRAGYEGLSTADYVRRMMSID